MGLAIAKTTAFVPRLSPFKPNINSKYRYKEPILGCPRQVIFSLQTLS